MDVFIISLLGIVLLLIIYIIVHKVTTKIIINFLHQNKELHNLCESLTDSHKKYIYKKLRYRKTLDDKLLTYLKTYISVVTSDDQVDIHADVIYRLCSSDIFIYKRIENIFLKFQGSIRISDIIDLNFVKDPPTPLIYRTISPIILSNGPNTASIQRGTSYEVNGTGLANILLTTTKIVNIHCTEEFYSNIRLYFDNYKRKRIDEETCLERK